MSTKYPTTTTTTTTTTTRPWYEPFTPFTVTIWS
jgi:hypothetical protein